MNDLFAAVNERLLRLYFGDKAVVTLDGERPAGSVKTTFNVIQMTNNKVARAGNMPDGC